MEEGKGAGKKKTYTNTNKKTNTLLLNANKYQLKYVEISTKSQTNSSAVLLTLNNALQIDKNETNRTRIMSSTTLS